MWAGIAVQFGLLARPEGFEPPTRGFEGDRVAAQSEGLRVVATQRGGEGGDCDPACFPLLPDDSSRNVTGYPVPDGGRPTHGADLEAPLAEALTLAAAKGRFDVVAQLARELEARRLARAGNVVRIDQSERGRR